MQHKGTAYGKQIFHHHSNKRGQEGSKKTNRRFHQNTDQAHCGPG